MEVLSLELVPELEPEFSLELDEVEELELVLLSLEQDFLLELDLERVPNE